MNVYFFLLLTAEEAESLWKVLKLKYVRQRKIAKTPSKPGSITREALEAKGKLDVYKLLFWLDEFIQTRRRKSYRRELPQNFYTNTLTENLEEETENEDDDNADDEGDFNKDTCDENQNDVNKAINPSSFVERKIETAVDVRALDDRQPSSSAEPNVIQKKRKISAVTRQEKWEKRRKQLVQDQELRLMKETCLSLKAAQENERKDSKEKGSGSMDEDKLYCALLAKKLSKMSDIQKMQVKHQIDNIVYYSQMQESVTHRRLRPPQYAQGGFVTQANAYAGNVDYHPYRQTHAHHSRYPAGYRDQHLNCAPPAPLTSNNKCFASAYHQQNAQAGFARQGITGDADYRRRPYQQIQTHDSRYPVGHNSPPIAAMEDRSLNSASPASTVSPVSEVCRDWLKSINNGTAYRRFR